MDDMSRSKKHTPICGNCSVTHGQKEFRTQENQAKRRKTTELLKYITDVNNEIQQYLIATKLPDEKEYGSEWASPRDGKHWLIKDIWKEQGYKYNRWLKK